RGLSRLTSPNASIILLPSCGQGRALLRRQGTWMGLRIVERPKSQPKAPGRNDNAVSFAVIRIHGGQAVEKNRCQRIDAAEARRRRQSEVQRLDESCCCMAISGQSVSRFVGR